jgi:CRP-like cAMP-binding protein
MKAQTLQDQPDQQDLVAVAKSFVPLGALKRNYLEYLLQQASVDYICAGQRLFEQGVCDYRHQYLLHGHLRLTYSSGYEETISARDSIFPLVNEMPRPCDGTAETDCTVLRFDSDRLDRILSWSQIADYLLSELSAERDYDEDIGWIKTVLNSNLFYKVPPVNAERILDRMVPQVVMAGEVIVRQGEIGNCCYFIKEGAARVTRREERGAVQHLADIGVGRCFGEDALVYETLRNASVTMTTDGVLMRLGKEDFKLLLLEPQVEEVAEEDFAGFSEAPVYVDVRTQSEYDEGHLVLAANLPLNLLSLKKRLLRQSIPYVFYCDTGRRSRAAAYLLGKEGYNTFALRGGLVGAGMQYQLTRDVSYMLRDGVVAKG